MWKAFNFLIILLLTHRIMGMSDEMKELAQSLHTTCVGETGVSEDLIIKARTGDFADDGKLKCYMKCILDQMACVDEHGTIDVEATIAVLPDEIRDKGSESIEKCQTKVGSDPCDTVFQTNKCWYNSNPDLYFLV